MPLIYVIAGEPSGDLLGGRLMAALKERTGGTVTFAGIGGETMRAQGLDSLFPMAELSVMGLVEVLPKVPQILRRLRQTVDDIAAKRPAAVVTIDSWGFTGRVAKRLQQVAPDIPRIHYVAPMVWAWREGRAKHLAERLDMLMCLLPNEPPYFERHGLKTVHVGHPVIESGADKGQGPAFRARHGIPTDAPLLCVLPGSRHSEVSRLLPVFGEALRILAPQLPGLRLVVPTVETVADTVAAATAGWPGSPVVLRGGAEKYDAFAAADAALAASGTVALELALARLPAVITYRVTPVTAFLARRLLKVRYANLVNLLLDRPAVPELIQEHCTPEAVARSVMRLLTDPAAAAAQRAALGEAMDGLGYGGPSPSLRAADAVLELMKETRI